MQMKNVYFLSDAHLGSWATDHRRTQERRLVRFLDDIKQHASAVYLLGDMFDFWYEYKYVVPKGYTRFLGKVSELADSGIEIHFFTGNHDLWVRDYFEKECGMTVHREPIVTEMEGKLFYLAHGDGLGCRDARFRFLRAVFHNRVCQRLFSTVHPRWAMYFGLSWARHSRLKRIDGNECPYLGADREEQVLFARKYLATHPEINYFVFGHRHIELDLQLSETARLLIVGEWMQKFTYAVFDGEHLFLENYIEGESKP
jgi:UDP-2,3-diacylglucosamine hydrolase